MENERRHQRRLRRMGYQFPAAKKIIHDGADTNLITGWVVPILHAGPGLYGVVRYFPDRDSSAFIESEHTFPDVPTAEAWIREQIAKIKKEREGEGNTMIEGELYFYSREDRVELWSDGQQGVRIWIKQDSPLEIFLAGHWISGIFHPVYDDFWDLQEYRLECPDESYCGLLSGMKARIPMKKEAKG